MTFLFDFYFILPEVYLLTSTFILLTFSVLNSGSHKVGYPLLIKSLSFLSFQILLFTLILIFLFPYYNIISWNFFFFSNFYILCSKIILLITSLFWIWFSSFYINEEKLNSPEYWILILFSIIAFLFILQSYDLLSIYLSIEFQSLSFYVLASFKRTSEFSTEAGLKYFILGAFSSAFLLFGSSLLYGFTGLTNLEDFNTFFTGFVYTDKSLLSGTFIGLLFLTSSLFFKLSVAPFHMWSPDVYEGSPTSVTSFFSIFPKLVIITLLLKVFFFSFYDLIFIWKSFFLLSIFLSLFIGSLGALIQKKWKRFLAYSSINHIGFILMGFLLGESVSVTNILLYLIIYIITTFAIFAFLMSFRFYYVFKYSQARYLQDVISLAKLNPLLAISLSIILFSMAGIPPLAGFFAKVFMLITGVQCEVYSLLIVAVILSSVSCFYYIRLIQLMYFLNVKRLPMLAPMNKPTSIVIGFSCFFLMLFFLDIELIYLPIKRMALAFIL